ncbi:MAG: sigma-E factor negative regulatory protein, partial [Gammaproteobacteria bacterium]
MTDDERSSQLSAMFDGELPPAECELLARRLARDEALRRQWGGYALIGASVRGEPLAAHGAMVARADLAARV